MKTLLRQTFTGLYLQSPRTWTDDPSQALDFRFVDRALQHVHTWGLKGVELVFSFDDPQTVTAVSLDQTVVHYAAA